MTSHIDNFVERPAGLTAGWLTGAVGAGTITDFTSQRIGTGQMSECYVGWLEWNRNLPAQ
jgi:hypothetical protein